MKNITLQQFFKELINTIIDNKEPEIYYYKRKNFYSEKDEYIQITEVDLMSSRFKTIDSDFSEFEWELKQSNIYKE